MSTSAFSLDNAHMLSPSRSGVIADQPHSSAEEGSFSLFQTPERKLAGRDFCAYQPKIARLKKRSVDDSGSSKRPSPLDLSKISIGPGFDRELSPSPGLNASLMNLIGSPVNSSTFFKKFSKSGESLLYSSGDTECSWGEKVEVIRPSPIRFSFDRSILELSRTKEFLSTFSSNISPGWHHFNKEDRDLIVRFLNRCLQTRETRGITSQTLSICFEGGYLNSVLADIAYLALLLEQFDLLELIAKQFPLVFGWFESKESGLLVNRLMSSLSVESLRIQEILHSKVPFLFERTSSPIIRSTPCAFLTPTSPSSQLNWQLFLSEDLPTQINATLHHVQQLLYKLDSEWDLYGNVFLRFVNQQKSLSPDLSNGLFRHKKILECCTDNKKLWSLILSGLDRFSLKQAWNEPASHPICSAETTSGQTLLHRSLQEGINPPVESLQSFAFEFFTKEDFYRKTPLHYAIDKDCVEYAIWCLRNEKLADWIRTRKDSTGNFLHYSISQHSSKCALFFGRFPELLTDLTSEGADVLTLAVSQELGDPLFIDWLKTNAYFLVHSSESICGKRML